MSDKSGFTLIELLVVVAIISVLVAILLPAVQGAQEQARGGVCLSNLRQQAFGFSNYNQENHDFMPYGGNNKTSLSWPYVIGKCDTTRADHIYACPSDPWAGKVNPPHKRGISYAANQFLCPGTWHTGGKAVPARLSEIDLPSFKVVTFEARKAYLPPDGWAIWLGIVTDVNTWHQRGTAGNYLLADYHAESWERPKEYNNNLHWFIKTE